MRGKHLELRRNNDINAVCSLLFDAFSPGYGRKSLGLSRLNVSLWETKMFVLYITGECHMLGVSSSEEPAVSPFPTALCGIFPGLLVQCIQCAFW